MIIEKDKVVEFDYRLSDGDGDIIEDTAENGPMTYLHGYGNILAPLEAALEGRSSGDSFKVEITPEEGFGYRDENRVQRIPTKHLEYEGRLIPGKVATVNTREGPRQIVVLKVGRFNVDADFNHPFAGLTLNFEVDVIGVRDAAAEELEHGHAHGPGGHQHG
ncbi:MAG: peptidylprolyl isomerase [Proteobacteria bacterium]|nr:MAG: peptidylprolyl isomerase [Pseudomonadota bacterium]